MSGDEGAQQCFQMGCSKRSWNQICAHKTLQSEKSVVVTLAVGAGGVSNTTEDSGIRKCFYGKVNYLCLTPNEKFVQLQR